MLRRYVEQLLSLYNFVDGLMVTDENGVIKYFATFRPEINNLKEEEVLGKNVLDIYPHLTKESSSIFRVLKNGEPIHNEKQNLKTYKGQEILSVNTTLPIMRDGKLIGAIDVSRYVEPEYQRKNVALTLKEHSTSTKGNLYTLDDIITQDSTLLQVKEKVRRVAETKSSVLITGETGTGKELVAQSLHSHSKRSDKPFISQNCAAIPSTLLESILFGTVKGSYTGAENRKGLFEQAEGGTLFLDEINSMETNLQAKLLKAIEEKKIRRVGGFDPIPTDVRLVSALNQNPRESIKNDKLREDLFYRLGVVHLHLPPLRERKKDISLLTDYFINKFNHKMNFNVLGISERVEKLFYNYSWPGNVRELKNVIEGAFNLSNNNILEKEDLPEYLSASQRVEKGVGVNENLGEKPLKNMVEDYEKKLLKEALEKCENKAQAARLLKISKQSLQYKLNKYQLD